MGDEPERLASLFPFSGTGGPAGGRHPVVSGSKIGCLQVFGKAQIGTASFGAHGRTPVPMRCPIAFAILDTATTNKNFLMYFVEVNVLVDNTQPMFCLDRSGRGDTFV